MWAFYRDVFGYWRWEHLRETTLKLYSHDGFETHAACVEDAIRHGYMRDELDELQCAAC